MQKMVSFLSKTMPEEKAQELARAMVINAVRKISTTNLEGLDEIARDYLI